MESFETLLWFWVDFRKSRLFFYFWFFGLIWMLRCK